MAQGEARVRKLFGSIAGGYDFLNHTLSCGLDILWRRALVRSVSYISGPVFLDLAAGTCDVTLALARHFPERLILAGDLSEPMLRQGAKKISSAAARKSVSSPDSITLFVCDAFALPLADSSVSAVTIAFGLRNMRPRNAALAEVFRVLRPGGRLSVLEFGNASRKLWGGAYNFYLKRVMPRIGGLLSGDREAYQYLADTIRKFPLAWELKAEMERAGFGRVVYTSMSGGIVYLHTADKAL